ncbi:hypothetical protein J2W91_004431 [Paenibacillus amylolyticus]|uniref:DUF1795 domain-containing protein n=1 Tax=Paenibacillus amylolyticus TaxID=1451 RepID=A0AAP5H8L9_PAEAM|nr:hypothetical protein [Paenibacillus amylolyticus]MDR6725926.1 hypothetical protein [Paenibacillus amylolyticus]
MLNIIHQFMKTTRLLPRTITIAAALTLTLTGCATQASTSSPAPVAMETETKTEEKNHVLSSTKNEVEITAPLEWNTFDYAGLPALFTAMNKKGDGMIMINRSSRADTTADASIEDFMKNWEDEFSFGEGSTFESKRTGSMTIDTEEAFLTEGTMTLPETTGHFISASLEKENHFYRLLFSLQREMNDEDRESFNQIAQSLRILDDQPTVVETAPASSFTKLIKSDDEKTSIRVPSIWLSEFKMIPDADLEATSPNGEEYMMHLKHLKSEFDPGTTLDQYFDAYMEYEMEFLSDIAESDRLAVEIDGRPGIQLELHASVDKAKYGYLYTILEYPDHFAVISFAAASSRYDQTKEAYIEYTESYREEQ